MQQAARISDHTAFFILENSSNTIKLKEYSPRPLKNKLKITSPDVSDDTPRLVMQTHFEEELKHQDTAPDHAGHAEKAVNDAILALIDRNDPLAPKLKSAIRSLTNSKLTSTNPPSASWPKAPLATDLRLITVAMKISQNLERVGDEATSIAGA